MKRPLAYKPSAFVPLAPTSLLDMPSAPTGMVNTGDDEGISIPCRVNFAGHGGCPASTTLTPGPVGMCGRDIGQIGYQQGVKTICWGCFVAIKRSETDSK